MENSNKKDLIVTLSILLAIVFIVAGVLVTNKKKPEANSTVISSVKSVPDTSASPAATAVAGSTATTASTSSGFKDGTYTATAEYATPEATENIKVSVTLKNGIVTDTSSTASMQSRESREYATQFAQNYKSYVVGKSVASIKLSRVSGSSLTSQGFNDAIAQNQTQAKA